MESKYLRKGPVGDLNQKAGELVRQLDALARRFMLSDRQAGDEVVSLTRQEFRVIAVIGDSGSSTMGELAAPIMLAVSSLTSIIDSLVAKRLVERGRADEDRRVVRVRLTAAGRTFYMHRRRERLRMARAMLGSLRAQEQGAFLALMGKISRGLLEDERKTKSGREARG